MIASNGFSPSLTSYHSGSKSLGSSPNVDVSSTSTPMTTQTIGEPSEDTVEIGKEFLGHFDAGFDQVTLSGTTSIGDTADVRQAKIAEIRARFSQETYSVSPEALADAMLRKSFLPEI